MGRFRLTQTLSPLSMGSALPPENELSLWFRKTVLNYESRPSVVRPTHVSMSPGVLLTRTAAPVLPLSGKEPKGLYPHESPGQ